MPNPGDYEEDERDKSGESDGKRRRFQDFDCPECNANNPADETIGDGEEVRCSYCGQEFRVTVTDEGKMKLREA